jgi:hypothetical protein
LFLGVFLPSRIFFLPPFDGAAEPYEFVSESLVKRQTHIEAFGMRGTRSAISENVSLGPYTVSGRIIMHPTPSQLANLLPRILGAAAVGNTYALAETVPAFPVLIDRKTKVFTYSDCKVSRALFRSSAGKPLELTLELEGITESVGAAGTFPALTLGTRQPYMHFHAAITLAGASREVNGIEIAIDNGLILDRINNSLMRTALPEGERTIRMICDCPYSIDEADLYNQAVGGSAGRVIWTSGASSLAFDFARLQTPDRSPHVLGCDKELPLRLDMTARKSAGTPELVVTNIAA